jgi:hypothetical protein
LQAKRITMESVASLIRKRIAAHAWKPGQRIPTKAELRSLFGASDMTVQRALNLVNAQGFTVSRGCKGTFVVDRPPHLHRFGLVLPGGLNSNLMMQTLGRAAFLAAENNWWLTVHDQCTHWQRESPSFSMQELAREVDESQFAGLFFGGPYFTWSGSPILAIPRLPRLFLSGYVPPETGAGCRLERTWGAAFAELARQGRRRIALLGCLPMVFGGEAPWLQDLHKEAEASGLKLRNEWAQAVSTDHPGAVRQSVRLLLSFPERSRPDGLYIMDDHLVTPACEAVAGSGIPPGKITVIAHANFPNLQPAAVPVVDVGYDLPRLLDGALKKLSAASSEGRTLNPDDWVHAGVEVRKRR